MTADLSSRTFDATAATRAVVAQQGRVLLDADLNEQADVTTYHDETRTRDVVGRTGGPAPDDGGPGAFALIPSVVDPDGTPWPDLALVPGRYYVDGVLVQATSRDGGPIPLDTQPFLDVASEAASIHADGDLAVRGIGEPEAKQGDRYALYLEVRDREVTGDENPRLLEAALGGPDTAVRSQTVWQVKSRKLEAQQCADLGPAFFAPTPPRMKCALQSAEADLDMCRISASGGYQRLDNQLYLVQAHRRSAGATTYLWSRENGSVTARVTAVAAGEDGADVVITQDRLGRDPELMIGTGDLIELTTRDRDLLRRPGLLARVQRVVGLALHATWVWPDAPDPARWQQAATELLGAGGTAGTGLVRRWDGELIVDDDTVAHPVEDGIVVAFDGSSTATPGDFWQVPARAVQLGYGITERRGTIVWPPPGYPQAAQAVQVTDPAAVAVPAMGPAVHVAPIAILRRGAKGWLVESDCRSMFPSLTALTSIDFAGGDGQEALPNEWLDRPVRVVVRRGSLPVAGVPVRFTADAGVLARDDALVAEGPSVVATTGPDGVASVRWRLRPEGPVTQVLTVKRVDRNGNPVDVAIEATARLSTASQVAFAPQDGCRAFAGETTVQGALDRLAASAELRLQGGDGQVLAGQQPVLRFPIRVIVDSACGPVAGVKVIADPNDGARVRALATVDEAWPGGINDVGVDVPAEATTFEDGSALFWWSPWLAYGVDTLKIFLADDAGARAPIVVSCHRSDGGGAPAPATPPYAHIKRIWLPAGDDLLNDTQLSGKALMEGIAITIDQPLHPGMNDKPVLSVRLNVPWAIRGFNPPTEICTHPLTLGGFVSLFDEQTLLWTPAEGVKWLLSEGNWSKVLTPTGVDGRVDNLLGQVYFDGRSTLTVEGLPVSTATYPRMTDEPRVDLPFDDSYPEGIQNPYIRWFTLVRRAD